MQYSNQERLKLSGFNNLTKVLSFNLYDFCIAIDQKQREEYIEFINTKYNAQRIVEISKEICNIIDANILNISEQNYDPVGASSMVLMSDVKGQGKWEGGTAQVKCHLDKSHITAHTYPDASDPNGICSFRVDIDIATCGEIIPLDAVNYLFRSFECDVVFIDYVVRGFTRCEDGSKIYNDHYFNSIQDFIDPKILADYQYRSDLNLGLENIWQTKLMVRDFGPERYLMKSSDMNHPSIDYKMTLLNQEMRDVLHLK
jgi:S-adenosylmethionine decarboxylase